MDFRAISPTPSGEVAAAVDRFFDRATEALPTFVSKAPSLALGAVTSLLVVVGGGIPVNEDRKKHAQSDDLVLKFRWVVMLGTLLTVAGMAGEFVQDFAYNFANLVANRQHFVNVHWLKLYMKALR
jgi:hypothetical protein